MSETTPLKKQGQERHSGRTANFLFSKTITMFEEDLNSNDANKKYRKKHFRKRLPKIRKSVVSLRVKRDHMAKLTILGVISIPKWYPLKMRGKQNAYEGVKGKTIIKD